MAKIMNVFYGTDALPYKDQERQVHYPIASGNTFNGSSLVDTIHFYVSEIGGTQDIEWVANVKRADGKIGYKKLSPTWDNDIQEYYVSLSLSQWFTAKNGDIFISLNGYQGGLTLEYDSTSQVYTSVSGTPIVQATGCIKLNISYAVQMNNDYGELPSISVQEALGLTTSKLDKNSGKYLKVIDDIANINSGSYTPFLSNGDIIYCKTNKAYYSLSFSDNLYTATLLDLTLFSNIKVLGKILASQNNTYGFTLEDTTSFTSDKVLATKNVVYINITDETQGTLSESEAETLVYADNPIIILNKTTSGTSSRSFVFYKEFSIKNALGNTLVMYFKEGTGTQISDLTSFQSIHQHTIRVSPAGRAWYFEEKEVDFYSKSQVDDNLQLKADKSDTYTKAQTDSLISTVKSNSFQKVDTTDYPTLQDFLDNYDNPEEGDIYLYPVNTSDLTQGYYQYIWEEDSSEWINLGTTQIDLSNYYTKSQTNDYVEDRIVYVNQLDTSGTFTDAEYETLLKTNSIICARYSQTSSVYTDTLYIKENQSDNNGSKSMTFKRIQEEGRSGYRVLATSYYTVNPDKTWTRTYSQTDFYNKSQSDTYDVIDVSSYGQQVLTADDLVKASKLKCVLALSAFEIFYKVGAYVESNVLYYVFERMDKGIVGASTLAGKTIGYDLERVIINSTTGAYTTDSDKAELPNETRVSAMISASMTAITTSEWDTMIGD